MSNSPGSNRSAIIVGTGAIADAHAEAYQSPNVRQRAMIAAAVDVDGDRAEAFCRKHGVPRWFTTMDEALEAVQPALAHICSPPGFHTEQSIAAMNAGAWVLCEKPPCASLEELDAIQDAERRTGTHCATVFQWRFGSGMQHAKRMIDTGALGRPLVAVCNTLWYRDSAYYAVPWRGKWSTEIGGPTVGHGIHLMDSLLYLLGDWEEVSACMATLDRDIEVEDVSLATVRFANGALGSIVNSVLSPRQETYLRIDFQQATVEATGLYSVSNGDWRWTGRPETDTVPIPRIPDEVPASHTTVVEAILDNMDSGKAPLTSGKESYRTVEFITALYKSAHTAQPVRSGTISRDDPFYGSFRLPSAALGNHYRAGGGN